MKIQVNFVVKMNHVEVVFASNDATVEVASTNACVVVVDDAFTRACAQSGNSASSG